MISLQIPRLSEKYALPYRNTYSQKPIEGLSFYEHQELEDMGHEARDRDVAPTSIDGMLRHCCLLASIMLPGRPGADFGHQLIHIEAYIADVDIRNVVTFKLTTKSIEALTQYHTEIYWVDAKAFVGTVNKFEYWTHVSALELESDGTGELLDGKSCEVKEQLLNLMDPLLIAKPALIED